MKKKVIFLMVCLLGLSGTLLAEEAREMSQEKRTLLEIDGTVTGSQSLAAIVDESEYVELILTAGDLENLFPHLAEDADSLVRQEVRESGTTGKEESPLAHAVQLILTTRDLANLLPHMEEVLS